MSRVEPAVQRRARPRGRLQLPADPRHLRRLLGLVLSIAVAAVTVGSTLTGHSATSVAAAHPLSDASIVAGPPHIEVLARAPGAIQIFVPIDQHVISAVAYHPVEGSHAYTLVPVGHQVDAGVMSGVVSRIFGSGSAGMRYYVDGGSSQAVDVGAPAGTDVYSPVNGQIVSITPNIIDGDALDYGATVSIQPTSNPSIVVNVSPVALPVDAQNHATIQVGQHVNITPPGSPTRLGTVVDLSHVVHSVISNHVSGGGNDVSIEADPALNVSIP